MTELGCFFFLAHRLGFLLLDLDSLEFSPPRSPREFNSVRGVFKLKSMLVQLLADGLRMKALPPWV